MRPVTFLAAALALSVLADAPAHAGECEDRVVSVGNGQTRIITTCGEGQPSDPAASPSPSAPSRFWGSQLIIGPARAGPDGLTCYEIGSVAFTSATARDAHQGRVGRVIAAVQANPAVYLRCDAPSTAEGEEPSAPAPEQVAEAFINAVDFRPPEPVIQPGYAIAGLPAFLEPGGTDAVAPITRSDTPYGTFLAEARQSLRVHWGQGAVDALTGDSGWITYGQRSGGPWPSGDVSFVYRDPGAVTVQVVRDWAFEWTFSDGPSGRLAFSLDASVGPFEVDEVQAVRVR